MTDKVTLRNNGKRVIQTKTLDFKPQTTVEFSKKTADHILALYGDEVEDVAKVKEYEVTEKETSEDEGEAKKRGRPAKEDKND